MLAKRTFVKYWQSLSSKLFYIISKISFWPRAWFMWMQGRITRTVLIRNDQASCELDFGGSLGALLGRHIFLWFQNPWDLGRWLFVKWSSGYCLVYFLHILYVLLEESLRECLCICWLHSPGDVRGMAASEPSFSESLQGTGSCWKINLAGRQAC